MKYTLSFSFFFCFIIFNTSAQKKQSASITNVAKINLFNPGVSYEKKINSNQTLYLNAFYNPSLSLTNNGFLSNTAKFVFEPSAAIQYRFYYNIPLRADKMNMLNSYNYVCPVFELSFSKKNVMLFNDINNKYTATNKIGALWGMQRNYKSHFSLDFNIGVGYISYNTKREISPNQFLNIQVSTIRPMGHLNLGFYFGYKN